MKVAGYTRVNGDSQTYVGGALTLGNAGHSRDVA